MYWDLNRILPYQRTFNFINGPRSIGKTYTLLKWLIKEGIEKGKQFVYICRTQDEKKHGVLLKGIEKVCQREYPNIKFKGKNDWVAVEDKIIGYCIALNEAIKIKKESYPNVYYIMFDEYQIEGKTGKYVSGMHEPELFITIYHTIDREENRVKCFFLGNNTSYYNPYHLYPLFGFPPDVREITPGTIWKNKLTLFERAVPSEELRKRKEGNIFIQGLQGTRYGEYATLGVYIDDNYSLIEKLSGSVYFIASVTIDGKTYGLYQDFEKDTITFSDKYDKTYYRKYGIGKANLKEGIPLLKTDGKWLLSLIKKYMEGGILRYSSMNVKSVVEPEIIKLL